ncbi:MAG: hypothetical protein K8T25_06820 [Planctomycetia bacterium]|nr:hypothetical protein [Planctomycetia bacterium]
MKNGYQIIEPKSLQSLISNPLHFEFAVAILHWLIPKIYSTVGTPLSGVIIEIICVEYLGSYPAIGIKYENEAPSNVGPLVESAIDTLLHERPVIEFAVAAGQSDVSWTTITSTIMAKPG